MNFARNYCNYYYYYYYYYKHSRGEKILSYVRQRVYMILCLGSTYPLK